MIPSKENANLLGELLHVHLAPNPAKRGVRDRRESLVADVPPASGLSQSRRGWFVRRLEGATARNRPKRTYKYEAMDTNGREVKDSVEALSEKEALQKIRQRDYFATKITASAASASSEVQLETKKELVTQQAPPSNDTSEFVLSLDMPPLGDGRQLYIPRVASRGNVTMRSIACHSG